MYYARKGQITGDDVGFQVGDFRAGDFRAGDFVRRDFARRDLARRDLARRDFFRAATHSRCDSFALRLLRAATPSEPRP